MFIFFPVFSSGFKKDDIMSFIGFLVDTETNFIKYFPKFKILVLILCVNFFRL